MALTMALQASRLRNDGGRKVIERVYDVTLTGSYVNNGTTGDVIDFTGVNTTLSNPNNLERALFGGVPTEYAVENQPAGFIAYIVPAATLSGWGLRLYQTGSGNNQPFSELANGAYPGGLTGITAGFRLVFREPAK